MLLLRTSYRYEVFLEQYFKLQINASWSIHGKTMSRENANLRCILSPKKLNLLHKKTLTFYPLENLELPDKKLNSLGIILIP